MADKNKIDKNIYAVYKSQNLSAYQFFCYECFKNISFTQPCPVCKGNKNAKKVQKLPTIKKKGYSLNRKEIKEFKRCNRCSKYKKTTEEFNQNFRGHYKGICIERERIVNEKKARDTKSSR